MTFSHLTMNRLSVTLAAMPDPGRRGRGGRSSFLAPAIIGLALCGFAVWGFITAAHSSASFAAHSVVTTAVIQRIYTGASSGDVNGPARFDEFAHIQYVADGRPQIRQITLVSGCVGECFPAYRIGEELHVAVDPRTGDVVFPVPRRGTGVDTSGMGALAWIAVVIGAGSLLVAVSRTGRVGQRRARSVTP